MATKNSKQDFVFGLDIGTRNVVGIVGLLEHNKFKIVGMAQKEHDTRAMMDGQIHDIYKVGDTIRYVKQQLERQIECELTEVCIAAAGRVLKTVDVHEEMEVGSDVRIGDEEIYSLNMLGVEKAHGIINNGAAEIKFYCVGNTPTKYYLNGYEITSLEGHKADKIGVDLIATFLPEEVVDGLYEAVSYAGLNVANLTLEPIAAINVAIPVQYRLLNIALIDVGAGTSDICITKDGSVASYGMIPSAGDEITEVVAKKYLVDFNTAEKIKLGASKKKGFVSFKDIMGLSQKVDVAEIRSTVDSIVSRICKDTADRILELNGGKPVSAVFVVGGGGKIPDYTVKLAKDLKIPTERVALRGEEVMGDIDFSDTAFSKDSLYVTPVGICMTYYSQKNSFVFVTVNGSRLKMYDNNHLTVVDALLQAGFPNDDLFPKRGEGLSFTVNGKHRMARGSSGEAAVIRVNGKEANMNASIDKNDQIEVIPSTRGANAVMTVGQLEEFQSVVRFMVNGKEVECPKFAYVNGTLQSEFYEISSGDDISMENFYTVKQLFEFLDIDLTHLDVYVNNVLSSLDDKVYENFTVDTRDYHVDSEDDTYLADRDEKVNEEMKKESTDHESKKHESTDSVEDTGAMEKVLSKDVHILVNSTSVTLTGKASYIFVDVFLVYDFDLSTPKGDITLTRNGVKVSQTEPIMEGDVLTITWE